MRAVDLIEQHLINRMFTIAGSKLRYKDVLTRQDDWYSQNTMTLEQNQRWRREGAAYLMKKLRMNKKRAIAHMEFFNLMYGLRVEEKSTSKPPARPAR